MIIFKILDIVTLLLLHHQFNPITISKIFICNLFSNITFLQFIDILDTIHLCHKELLHILILHHFWNSSKVLLFKKYKLQSHYLYKPLDECKHSLIDSLSSLDILDMVIYFTYNIIIIIHLIYSNNLSYISYDSLP